MNIAVVSVFDVSLLEEYVYPEYRERIRRLDSNFTPAVSSIVMEWLRKGEHIIVFTQDVKATEVEVFHGERVSAYVAPRIPGYKKLLTLGSATSLAIRRLFSLHKGDIDVVSAHWTRDYAIAAGHYLGKVPVFVTVRDIMPNILSRATSNRLRWRYIWLQNEYVMRRKGYRLIANSEYTAHEVKRLWGHDIPVIPNSVAIPEMELTNADSRQRKFEENVITSITLGDIHNTWKNIPALLEAFLIFRKSHHEAVLNLVGPYFSDDNPLVAEYRKSGLMEGVRLMGRRSPEEVRDILKASSMMVHPSLEETFGNTLIEALSLGVPVVGGRHSGAVPWVLDQGETGYLCDVSSPQDMADTMLQVADNYEEALEKARKGKLRCAIKYSISTVADRYLQVFHSGQDTPTASAAKD